MFKRLIENKGIHISTENTEMVFTKLDANADGFIKLRTVDEFIRKFERVKSYAQQASEQPKSASTSDAEPENVLSPLRRSINSYEEKVSRNFLGKL